MRINYSTLYYTIYLFLGFGCDTIIRFWPLDFYFDFLFIYLHIGISDSYQHWIFTRLGMDCEKRQIQQIRKKS